MKNTFLIFSLLLIVASCRRGGDSQRLDDINALTESSRPDSALTLLAEINADSLSKADGAYFSLLKIKAADKAYIRHSSDSAIMEVLKYYEDHKSDVHYPEALYYGGRVYSDLGDYPSALRYFQEALDLLPENTESYKLKSSLLSQRGRVQNTLGLYKDAETTLKLALKYDSLNININNLAYDHQLLGAIQVHLKNFHSAKISFQKAKIWAHQLSSSEESIMDAYIASVEYKIGKYSKALSLIRGLPEKVSQPFKNVTMSWAAQIYRDNGHNDTAAYYAKLLIQSKEKDNRKIGYSVLFSLPTTYQQPIDSIINLIKDYKAVLEEEYSDNDLKTAHIANEQINLHNVHKEISDLKNKNKYLKFAIIFCITILIILCFILSYNWHRLSSLKIVKHELTSHDEREKELKVKDSSNDEAKKLNKKITRIQLREKLLTDFKEGKLHNDLSNSFIHSDAFAKMTRMLETHKIIQTHSNLWEEMRNFINTDSPDFFKHLKLIASSKLSRDELNTLTLIKCGASPTSMSLLLGKSIGAISSRRQRLCIKIFGTSLGNTEFDSLIRNL